MTSRLRAARDSARSPRNPRTLVRVGLLAVAIVAVQLVVTMADAVVTTRSASQSMRETFGYIGDVVEARVETYIESGTSVVADVVAEVPTMDFDEADLVDIAQPIIARLKGAPAVSGVMVGLPDGRGASVNDEGAGTFLLQWVEPDQGGTCLRTSVVLDADGNEVSRTTGPCHTDLLQTEWYLTGSAVAGLVWTEPYAGAFADGVFVSPTQSVRAPDGDLVAVVAARFERQQLVNIIESVPSGDGSTAMVVGRGDTVIAAPSEFAEQLATSHVETGSLPTAADLDLIQVDLATVRSGEDAIAQVGDVAVLERQLRSQSGLDWLLHLRAPVEALAPAAVSSQVRLATMTGLSVALSALVVVCMVWLWRPARDVLRRSSTDPLTGLANRAELTRAGAALVDSASRDGDGVLVCVIDLDRFKSLNDTHGHDAGDRAIVAVAESLRATVRSRDVAARTGGDEFVAVIRPSCRADPDSIAQRVRAAAERGLHSAVPEAAGVGVTLGYATICEGGYDLSVLTSGADEALIASKAEAKGAAYRAAATASAV